MNQGLVVKGLLLLTGLALSACDTDSPQEPSGPELAFRRFKRAFESGDWRDVYQSYSPRESDRDRLLADAVKAASIMTSGDVSARYELKGLLEKHGVAVSDKWVAEEAGSDASVELTKSLFAKVKDKEALFSALLTSTSRSSRHLGGMHVRTDHLKDVRMAGDTATGIMVEKGGKETPAKFIQIDGMWYIVP